MLMNAQRASYVAAATLLFAGCSVLIESDKKQCTKDTQCGAPYVCGGQGLCEIKTGCTTSADCRQPGACIDGMCKPPECTTSKDDCEPGELCNTELGTCVREAQATCAEAKDCAPYEGAQVCITSDKLCGDAECKVKEDCAELSPTADCTAGACEDPTWGCLGVVDPRKTATSSKMASLKVKILYAFAQDGATETGIKDLTVRVCQFPDQTCMNVATEDWTYGDDNFLIIRGLESGLNYRVQLTAKHPKSGIDLLPTEYLMYRTVVEETVEPKPILMFEEATRTMISSYAEVSVDPSLGLVLMRIFDCTDIEVEGVKVFTDPVVNGDCGENECMTTVFYQNTNNQPNPTLSLTNAAGRAGVVNMKTTGFNTITLVRNADQKKITSFVVTPHAGWLTYVHFWPWDYATGN